MTNVATNTGSWVSARKLVRASVGFAAALLGLIAIATAPCAQPAATSPPITIRAEAVPMDYATALGQEAKVQGEMSRNADFAEGVAAFLQKRAPVFKDR